MRWCALLPMVLFTFPALAAEPPPGLPRYDLQIRWDTRLGSATIQSRITWTNTGTKPADDFVFNFFPHYRIPEGDHLLLAKTLELLRLNPSHGIDRHGRAGTVDAVSLIEPNLPDRLLEFSFRNDNPTAFVVPLPRPVQPGESVTVRIDCTIRLPEKQGRWGRWQGVNYLTNALPTAAFRDAAGWQAMPFVPWHQPWWNEAGHYTASIELPADEKLACPADIAEIETLPNGWKKLVTRPFLGRDFSLVASTLFEESVSTVTLASGKEVILRCLALPKHTFYARELLRIAAEALPVYSKWFGDYPYSQLTFVESYFGWNGNECAGLILIDERVFNMPKLAVGYVEYLASHETCHQWWYNRLGSNGYAETFIDEGAATFFTHRMLDRKRGRNNAFLDWPEEVKWLPNINRENYRYGSMIGAIRRDEMPAAAGELPGFNHLVGLFSGAYDRGSKVFAMIEDRLGPDGFDDFIFDLQEKYAWKVLSAAQLRAELEGYSCKDWNEFFERWVYGKGLTDWKIQKVEQYPRHHNMLGGVMAAGGVVEVYVRQTGQHEEVTTVGISLKEGDGYPIRVPVGPGIVENMEPGSSYPKSTPVGPGYYKVVVNLPSEPVQITVDPDSVLLDANPGDNRWHTPPKVTFTPLYSVLNDSDLTADYDRWNLTAGPWIGGALYPDPWYTRSGMAGVRAGAFRTQTFTGGLYAAVRSDFRDAVIGADALWDHFPLPKAQLGFNVEQRIGGPWFGTQGKDTALRASAFARHVFQYGSSLYLPPLHYVEAFTGYQDNFLPQSRYPVPGGTRPEYTYLSGLHWRLNLLTPYWDPECGIWADAVIAGGTAGLGYDAGTGQVRGELSAVRRLPDWCFLGPLQQARVAVRGVAMAGGPDRGEFFALGGGTLFRGFDLAERQGNALWVANAELRIPIVREVEWDVLDHTAGVRNIWLAGFYDVGSVYSRGREVQGVSHAVGAGLRVDTAIFSFIERATFRVDVAKTINASSPVQFWFGVQHPF
jgi:hypothetical protein